MDISKFLHMLCCPDCRGDLTLQGDELFCQQDNVKFQIVDGIPVLLDKKNMTWDVDIASDKWHDFYQDFDWEGGKDHYFTDNLQYIYKYLNLKKDDIFLELGGGPSYLSFDAASKVSQVVVIDFDLDILRLAKKAFAKHGRDALFVCANVNLMPFKDKTFTSSFGLGVIEHTTRIDKTVKDLLRVTKDNGHTFQTVPYFSFLTIASNALRFGSFTPIKLLNKLIGFLHIRLLKSKRMKYGYEESYTKNFLCDVFSQAGFSAVEADFYDYQQTLMKKNKFFSKIFYFLMRVKAFGIMPFADIVYVKARRGK